MPKLKSLSGDEVIRVILSFGFEVVSQRGSHVKVRRVVGGARQVLIIPNHKELDTGTLRALYRQALRHIPEADLAPHFYVE